MPNSLQGRPIPPRPRRGRRVSGIEGQPYSPTEYRQKLKPQEIIANLNAKEQAFIAKHGSPDDLIQLFGRSSNDKIYEWCRSFENAIQLNSSVISKNKSGSIMFSSDWGGDKIDRIYRTYLVVNSYGEANTSYADGSGKRKATPQEWVQRYISELNQLKRERDASIKFGGWCGYR